MAYPARELEHLQVHRIPHELSIDMADGMTGRQYMHDRRLEICTFCRRLWQTLVCGANICKANRDKILTAYDERTCARPCPPVVPRGYPSLPPLVFPSCQRLPS